VSVYLSSGMHRGGGSGSLRDFDCSERRWNSSQGKHGLPRAKIPRHRSAADTGMTADNGPRPRNGRPVFQDQLSARLAEMTVCFSEARRTAIQKSNPCTRFRVKSTGAVSC
jgi:hypothetical protein